MLNFILGFIGLGIFGWAGGRIRRGGPSILQGREGAFVYWIAVAVGLLMVILGWIRPWISN